MATHGMLFITGTSRAGTTTMADFLRADRRIVMGRERFAWRLKEPGAFLPALFEKRRFCLEYQPADSHHAKHQPYYGEAFEYFDAAQWVGDKLPSLVAYYDVLYAQFPECRVIYMLREPLAVAESYQRRADETRRRLNAGESDERRWPADRGWEAAVDEWNTAMRATLARIDQHPIRIMDYETLYRKPEPLVGLYAFLGLSLPRAMVDLWSEKGRERDAIESKRTSLFDDATRAAIDRAADWASYERMKALSVDA